MNRRTYLWLIAIAVVFLVMQVVLASPILTEDDDYYIVRGIPFEVVLYLGAVFLVLRDKGSDLKADRRAVMFILLVAALLRAIVIPIDGRSTDINRYIWDGRVQGAGINPYAYIPADPALKDLRDDEIYPDINRKDYAPTIYPPLAQIVFFLVTRISEEKWAMKLAMVAIECAGIWAMIRLLAARSMPPTRILIYAWHPLPIWEFAADGHVDAIAITCICLSLLAAETRRPFLAGIALGGATLTKFFPIVIGPAVYRRWDWKLPLAGAATILVLYLPYVGGGKKIFGFLSGYSAEEGLRDGSGFYPWLLLKHLVPAIPTEVAAFYGPVAALILLALGLFVVFRAKQPDAKQPGADLAGAFLLATTFTLLTSPHYIWYFAWLVPFLCFFTSWSVFWLTGAATFMNEVGWPPFFLGGSVLFLPFVAIVLVEAAVAIRSRRRARARPRMT